VLASGLAAPPARAGSYTNAGSGGASPATVTPTADGTIFGPLGASGTASVSPYSGNGNPTYTIQISPGTLTNTFTWVPASGQTQDTDPPPTCVLVEQSSSTLWYVRDEWGTGTGSGTGDCGLSGATATSGTYGGNGPSQSLSAISWSQQSGASFSVSCSPTASFTGTTGTQGWVTGEANVSGGASAYPITISLGGTKPDSSGNPNILVGQQCTATVNGIPSNLLPYTTFDWSGISGTKFESWTVSSDQSHTTEVDAIPATNPTQWYWNDSANASETVKCTVTITPPAGQGSPLSLVVTAPKPVSVQVPHFTLVGTTGYMQINTKAPNQNGALCLYAGPSAGQTGGINWVATSTTPPLFGKGTVELVQIATPNLSYTAYTGSMTGALHNDPQNGHTGLDGRYPYPGSAEDEGATPVIPFTSNDSPTLPLSNSMGSVTMQHQFTDYLMYAPPGSTQYVPLATMTWGTNGSATVPTTDNWFDYLTIGASLA